MQHAVPSYEGWKQAFDADPVDRAAAGVTRYEVHRAVTDPNLVMIDLEFDELASAEAFVQSLQQLWEGPGRAVTMNPSAWIIETVERVEL
ncbi:MAG: hypothetical protein WED87_06165 [Dehalococcoidia bacterium]